MPALAWIELDTEAALAQAWAIREAVFVVEQGIPRALDRDGHDARAYHVLALAGGEGIATGRLCDTGGGTGQIARIAVLPSYRGQRIGQAVVARLEAIARREGMHTVRLTAHAALEPFYQRLGYQTQPGTISVGSHRLLPMEKPLINAGDAPNPHEMA